MSHEEALRRQLYDAFKHRAILYYLFYDEIRREFGAAKAEEILSRAIYRRGVENGRKYAPFAPDNLAGLKTAFLGGIADNGQAFQPELLHEDARALDIKFHRCPLREAWKEYGLSDEETATLCRIAARVDNGTFEGAGFRFSADTWQPGGEGCCCLHIRTP
jgi:hypothetical protein